MHYLTQSSELDKVIQQLKLISYVALAVSIASAALVTVLAVQLNSRLSTGGSPPASIEITSDLVTPSLSLPNAPPITEAQPFGTRLTDINTPFNSTELASINNAPDSFFEKAARLYLNHSLSNAVGATTSASTLLKVNGRPAVIYLGAISCIYCGENRWAMSLALSRFGSFSQLFKGYSALGDGDVPTLYWAPAHYNSTSEVEFGNFYSSKVLAFLSIEYSSPIKQSFMMAPLSFFQQRAHSLNNPAYESAINIILGTKNYAGTPYTIWGSYSVPGADGIVFGDSPPSSGGLQIASMTHSQLLQRLANPITQFAWSEYAAADFYVALICATTSVSVPICSSPSIVTMVNQVKG